MERRWQAYVRKVLRKVLRAGAGWFLVFGLAGAARAADVPCARTVQLNGASELVPPVLSLLRQHGVASDSGCGAGAVRAWLQRDAGAGGHWLHIEDGFGRTSDRHVTDARTAASLIETWTLGEDAALLSPRASTATAAPAADVVAASVAATAAVAAPRWQVAASADLSIDPRGTALWGGAVRACGRVGPACVGGRARAAAGRGSTYVVAFDVPFDRQTVEGAVTALFPWTWSRLTLAPVLALGVGWERTTLAIRDSDVLVNLPGDIDSSRSELSLLMQPSLVGSVHLGAGWSVVAEFGLSLAVPLGDSGTASQQGAGVVPRGEPVTARAAVGVEFAR